MINSRTQEFIKQHGEWTAMAIKLPDGSYTLAPAVDHRLKRLVQAAQDFLTKPLAGCRVLDLACLEGHYAIEFAMHGAEVLGIEGRQVSVDKCNYVKNMLALNRAAFIKDDVRNLSANKHGQFDIVICSGILYHLTAEDAVKFVKAIFEVCTGILLLDTFISISGRSSLAITEGVVRGHFYAEHNDTDDEQAKSARLWASMDNSASFWFTEPTLINLLMDAGFTTICEILAPTMPNLASDRKTYLACRGRKAQIFTSDLTNNEPDHRLLEGANPRLDPSQQARGPIFNFAKRTLPRPIKNAIKPLLRAIKVLPPDMTPPFMKKSRTSNRHPS